MCTLPVHSLIFAQIVLFTELLLWQHVHTQMAWCHGLGTIGTPRHARTSGAVTAACLVSTLQYNLHSISLSLTHSTLSFKYKLFWVKGVVFVLWFWAAACTFYYMCWHKYNLVWVSLSRRLFMSLSESIIARIILGNPSCIRQPFARLLGQVLVSRVLGSRQDRPGRNTEAKTVHSSAKRQSWLANREQMYVDCR